MNLSARARALASKKVGFDGGFVQRIPARSLVQVLARPNFHLRMIYASIFILVVSAVGCRLTSIEVPEAGALLFVLFLAVILFVLLLLSLKERGKSRWADAILIIGWALFFQLILFYPVAVAARLGRVNSLQDSQLIRLDHFMGVNVVRFQTWAATHRLGTLVNKTYPLLFPFMRVSILLPILAGKLRDAQRFLTANLIAFAIGLPLFALFPAIGRGMDFILRSGLTRPNARLRCFSCAAQSPTSFIHLLE